MARTTAYLMEQFCLYLDNKSCDLTEDEFKLISERLCVYYNRMVATPRKYGKFELKNTGKIIINE